MDSYTDGKPPFSRLVDGIPTDILERPLELVDPEQPITWQLDSSRLVGPVVFQVAAKASCPPGLLGETLGLRPGAVEDVMGEFSGNAMEQREGMIRQWVEDKRERATLNALLEALYDSDDIDSVRLARKKLVTAPEAIDRRAADTHAVQPEMGHMLPTEKHHPTDSSVFSVIQVPRSLDQTLSPSPGSVHSDGNSQQSVRTPEDELVTGGGGVLSTAVVPRFPANVFETQKHSGTTEGNLEKMMSQMMKTVEERLEERLRARFLDDMKKLQDQITGMEKDIERPMRGNTELQELRAELNKTQKELKELKQINEQALAKLEERNAQLAEKERQLGAKNEKISTLEREKEEIEMEKKRQWLQMKEENDKVKQERDTLKKEMDHLEKQMDMQKKELQEKIRELQKKVKKETLYNQGVPEKWAFGSSLGEGTYGKVYECHDLKTGRQLAVKVIEIEWGRDSTPIQREVLLLQEMSHERIVPFYGTDTYTNTNEEYLYIFMEYMAGGSLRGRLVKNGALLETLARKFTQQLLEGVRYLHGKTIMHRDIKCDNILMESDGDIKLADFGLAKKLEVVCRDQLNSRPVGTARWLAPEAMSLQIFDFKSDIWSVGATVVEMLTGKRPFDELQNEGHIMGEIGRNKLKPTDGRDFGAIELSDEAHCFLDQCFKSNYCERPSAEQLLEESHWILSRD